MIGALLAQFVKGSSTYLCKTIQDQDKEISRVTVSVIAMRFDVVVVTQNAILQQSNTNKK
jgi:hypothetical protein